MFKLNRPVYVAVCLQLCLFALPAGPGTTSSNAGADGMYDQGVKAYNRGDYRGACAYLEQAIKTAPNDPNALYYDALCWHQMKVWKTATERYKSIVTLFPTSAAADKARQTLRTLDASWTPPEAGETTHANARSGELHSSATTPTGSSESSRRMSQYLQEALSESSDTPPDLASLPDKASFYFSRGSNGHMLVDLLVNGHPIKALFDTGASAFFYKDQLKGAGVDVNKAGAGGYTRGWAGVPVPLYKMPAEIKLGTLTRKLSIAMQESTGPNDIGSNLIGQDFVRGYQYEIDDKAGRVDLRKTMKDTGQKMDSLYDVPCVRRGKDDVVQIEINGHKVSAFIDTGASATIVDAATASQIGLEPSGEAERLMGVGGSFTVAIGYANIRVGPIRQDNFRVRIGGRAGCCIGQDFMEGWRFKVDREKNLLRFFH